MPRWRIPLGIAAAVTVAGLIFGREAAMDALHTLGEERSGRGRPAQIDGRVVAISGTNSRLFLLKLYRKAALQAGFIGFGSERTSGFPIHVPVDANDAKAFAFIRAVDNEFLLLQLRFGLIAVAAFGTICIASGAYCFKSALGHPGGPIGPFFGAMAGAMLGVTAMLCTVWLPADFGACLLWSCGSVAGLWAAQRGRSHTTEVHNRPRSRRAAQPLTLSGGIP